MREAGKKRNRKIVTVFKNSSVFENRAQSVSCSNLSSSRLNPIRSILVMTGDACVQDLFQITKKIKKEVKQQSLRRDSLKVL